MITVALTSLEIDIAIHVGGARERQNLERGRRDAHGCRPGNGWQLHVNGALGELAVAKLTGRYWEGMSALGDLNARDVLGLQVRWTSRPQWGLKINKSDRPADLFVATSGEAPILRVHGWISAGEAQQQQYWRDPDGRGRFAYFVPYDDLYSIEELPEPTCIRSTVMRRIS